MLGVCDLSLLGSYMTLFIPVLMYGSETVLWKEKERSRIGLYRWTTLEIC